MKHPKTGRLFSFPKKRMVGLWATSAIATLIRFPKRAFCRAAKRNLRRGPRHTRRSGRCRWILLLKNRAVLSPRHSHSESLMLSPPNNRPAVKKEKTVAPYRSRVEPGAEPTCHPNLRGVTYRGKQ